VTSIVGSYKVKDGRSLKIS